MLSKIKQSLQLQQLQSQNQIWLKAVQSWHNGKRKKKIFEKNLKEAA